MIRRRRRRNDKAVLSWVRDTVVGQCVRNHSECVTDSVCERLQNV